MQQGRNAALFSHKLWKNYDFGTAGAAGVAGVAGVAAGAGVAASGAAGTAGESTRISRGDGAHGAQCKPADASHGGPVHATLRTQNLQQSGM